MLCSHGVWEPLTQDPLCRESVWWPSNHIAFKNRKLLCPYQPNVRRVFLHPQAAYSLLVPLQPGLLIHIRTFLLKPCVDDTSFQPPRIISPSKPYRCLAEDLPHNTHKASVPVSQVTDASAICIAVFCFFYFTTTFSTLKTQPLPQKKTCLIFQASQTLKPLAGIHLDLDQSGKWNFWKP